MNEIKYPATDVWFIAKDGSDIKAYGKTSPEQVTTSKFELVQYDSEDAWKAELEANGVEFPSEDEEQDGAE
jgi:LPS sulfotransferase NodH